MGCEVCGTGNGNCKCTRIIDRQGVKGPQGDRGPAGAPGPDGDPGINAFTTVGGISGFLQPAASASVTATFAETGWMTPGQIIYIENGGHYGVSSVSSSTSAVIVNLGYPGNAIAGSPITPGKKVSPAGLKGDTTVIPVAAGYPSGGQDITTPYDILLYTNSSGISVNVSVQSVLYTKSDDATQTVTHTWYVDLAPQTLGGTTNFVKTSSPLNDMIPAAFGTLIAVPNGSQLKLRVTATGANAKLLTHVTHITKY